MLFDNKITKQDKIKAVMKGSIVKYGRNKYA